MWKLVSFHTRNVGEPWPSLQLFLEIGHRFPRPLRQDLDGPVGQVPREAAETQPLRRPLNEPAVPHPLHHSPHHEPDPGHER